MDQEDYLAMQEQLLQTHCSQIQELVVVSLEILQALPPQRVAYSVHQQLLQEPQVHYFRLVHSLVRPQINQTHKEVYLDKDKQGSKVRLEVTNLQ